MNTFVNPDTFIQFVNRIAATYGRLDPSIPKKRWKCHSVAGSTVVFSVTISYHAVI